jgi:very-short-patch-repair endonuclease
LFGSWGRAVEEAGYDYNAIRFAFKDQDSCLTTLDELLGEKAKREHTFGWLKDKGKLRLDGYYEKHRLAVEYDGPQHYESPGGYYTEDGLQNIQRRDRLKADLLRKHNITLLRIRYDEKKDKAHLRARLAQLRVRVPPGAAPS